MQLFEILVESYNKFPELPNIRFSTYLLIGARPKAESIFVWVADVGMGRYGQISILVLIQQIDKMSSSLHIIKLRQKSVIQGPVKNHHNLLFLPQKMVKVKSFCGAVFSPSDYQILLKNNIEHLQLVPMSKTFNTAQMLANGRLCPESRSCFYIYRQVYMGHTSYGILGEVSMQDYHENRIKKHEKTLHRPHLNCETYKREHVGPVVVGYRQDIQLKGLIINLTKKKQQLSSWATQDGREHTLWRIEEEAQAISAQFISVEHLYILDGHHRMEAAHQNYLLSEGKQEKDMWIQALLFSSQHIVVHPQHRAILDIGNSFHLRTELEKIESIDVADLAGIEERMKMEDLLLDYEIVLKEFDQYYGINFKNEIRNPLEKVSSVRLQSHIFLSLLDETVLRNIKYIPGIIRKESITAHDVVFFVRKSEVETLFEIADENMTLPPKSTWIEPKPCSHMVVRLL